MDLHEQMQLLERLAAELNAKQLSEASRALGRAPAASHNWWKFDLAISYTLLPSKSILLSNQCFL